MARKLKILITNSKSGAFWYICNGIKNAFNLCGHNAQLWNGDIAIWNNTKPDIYIGCSGWRQKFNANSNTKVAIHVNPYCNEVIQVPNGPVINESNDAIKWTISQKPDAVFGYGLQNHMKLYWNKWEQYAKVVPMPNAADITKYYSVPYDQNLAADIGWVGGYWPYKAINLDKYIIPVAKKFSTKWFGWSGPSGIWSGKVNDEEIVRKLFSSAKICPTVVEPHTTVYGIDMPERIFKVAACGGLVISDPVYNISDFFKNGSVIVAKNPLEYFELCRMWINKSNVERSEQAKKLRLEVLSKHTYLHRIKDLLDALNFTDEACDVQTKINELIKL